MYNLYFLEKKWRIEVKSGDYKEGTLKEVITFAETQWGFDPKEVDVALKFMLEKKHDSAHFGIGRHFIYSFDREFELAKENGEYKYGFH